VIVLDAHVHLWDLAVRPQPWTAQFPVLQRSFLLPDLERVLDDHGTDAAVVVQAGDTTDETLDLLALADTTPRLAGVVGWVDLDGPDVAGALAALRAASGGGKLVAVRHQLQVEPDPRYLARPGVRSGLLAVAEVTNVAVKLSGLVTEADWATWSQADLTPVLGHALTCFGADRAMAGSDWPVCLLAAGYGAVQATFDPALSGLDASGRAAVLGGTAAHWYRTGG
jgi:L-fuconolactonase